MKLTRRGFLKGLFGFTTAASINPKSAFSQDNLTNLERFELLKELINIRFLEISNEEALRIHPNNPLIIYFEDYHGMHQESEIRIIQEILFRRLQISNIAIEGWAGHSADKKRGVRLINGEEEVVKWILENEDKFNVIPLEDKRYQHITLMSTIYDIFKIKHIASQIKDFSDEQLLAINTLDEYVKYYLILLFGSEETLNGIINNPEHYLRIVESTIKQDLDSEIEKRYVNYLYEIGFENTPESILSMLTKVEDFFDEYNLGNPLIFNTRDKLMLGLRDEYASQLIVDSILDNNVNSMIVFFGVAHLNSNYSDGFEPIPSRVDRIFDTNKQQKPTTIKISYKINT